MEALWWENYGVIVEIAALVLVAALITSDSGKEFFARIALYGFFACVVVAITSVV